MEGFDTEVRSTENGGGAGGVTHPPSRNFYQVGIYVKGQQRGP